NGKPIAEKTFCRELEKFLKLIKDLPETPSYFELLYAFAINYFAGQKVDYAVIETGLGGLYDATNIITRADKVCLITDIGLDHTAILGPDLKSITKHKVCIVHENNPVIMYKQSPDIMKVIKDWTHN